MVWCNLLEVLSDGIDESEKWIKRCSLIKETRSSYFWTCKTCLLKYIQYFVCTYIYCSVQILNFYHWQDFPSEKRFRTFQKLYDLYQHVSFSYFEIIRAFACRITLMEQKIYMRTYTNTQSNSCCSHYSVLIAIEIKHLHKNVGFTAHEIPCYQKANHNAQQHVETRTFQSLLLYFCKLSRHEKA